MFISGMHNKDLTGISAEEMLDLYWYALDESSPLLMLNEKERITYVNKRFCSLTGYQVYEVQGLFSDFIHSVSHHEGFKKELTNQIQSGKTWKRKICIRTKTGEAQCFQAAFYPWPGRKDPVQHLIVLLPEVYNPSSQNKIQATNKEELSHLAHDLRNPLYNLSALCGLLFDTPLNDLQLDFVKKLKRTTGILSGMIDDMLLSCIGAPPQLKPETKLFALKKTVEDFHLHFSQRAVEKGIQTGVEADPSLPECVYGDARRLNQIIIYLVEFLLSHPPTRSIRISALTEDSSKGKSEVSFFVLGQFGPSTEEEKLNAEKIPLDLNLTLEKVKHNIELLQGSILLQEINKQAFYFHFSLSFDNNPPKEEKDETIISTEKEPSFPENVKILVAEDVELNQMVMKHQLKKIGVDADFVRTGFNVLEKLKIMQYDLILMDVQMPGLDGLQTIEAIRADNSTPFYDIPIIGITASIGGNARTKCLNAGANEFVPKPYEVEDLKNKIRKLIVNYRKQPPKEMETPSQNNDIPENEKFYDLNYLEEISEGDKEFSATMISYFIDNTPKVIENLKEKVGNKNWEGVRQIAHKLKPQLVYMGIHIIEEDVEQIEQYAHLKENLEKIPPMVAKTEQVCLLAMGQLKEELIKLNES
jgi:PAS domain S-box-containing protein